jgi:hypothetical protein
VLYALETNLLNDPKIIKALQEDEIEIVKVEKVYTDVNVSKNKKNYTIVVAKAKIPKIPKKEDERHGIYEPKNARNPWSTSYYYCDSLGKFDETLHIVFVILNNKKALDAILYERNRKVSLNAYVSLTFDSAKNYYATANDLPDRTVFALSSGECDRIRYFFLDDANLGYSTFDVHGD